MHGPSVSRRAVLTLAGITGVGGALAVGACSVTVDGPGSETTSSPRPSLANDGKIRLDFTKRPTREAFAMPEDQQFVSVDRKGPKLQVTIELPTGTVETEAFDVSLATNAGGGAGDPIKTHVPKYFNVLVSYPDAKSAFAALSEQAETLGLSKEDIALFRGDIGTDAVVSQQRVLRGLIKDWLSIEVVVSDAGDGDDPEPIQVNYEIDVDVFHNEAVDKVVVDGRFDLDLRTQRPSREDLGFLPTYGDADITALPDSTLEVVLRIEQGDLRLRADSITSGSGKFGERDRDPRGTKAPGFSILRRVDSNEDVEEELLANAGPLGLDAAAVRRVFAGSKQDSLTSATVTGEHYTLVTKVGADPNRRDAFAAEVSYDLVYR